MHCSRSYLHFKHVHLMLNQKISEAKEHLGINQLIELLPNLRHLGTSRGYIIFNENSIDFILNIIRRFNQLVKLILNKGFASYCKRAQKLIFQETLIQAINKHSFDCNTIRIQFAVSDYLCIWL